MISLLTLFYLNCEVCLIWGSDTFGCINFEGFSLHFGLNSPSVRPSSSWSLDVFATVIIEFCCLTSPHDITFDPFLFEL